MEKTGDTVRVLNDGELFCEYRTSSQGQPVVWPIVGPTGAEYTRSYPMGVRLEAEQPDHPHHQSLWFAHGDVNGHDFWHGTLSDSRTVIKHCGFSQISAIGNLGTIIANNLWRAKGKTLISDCRLIHFGVEGQLRWIDFTIKLTAVGGEVRFGDTKEGTFAMRVAGTMKVDSPGKGHIVNSLGQRDDKAWGTPANWVDYCGPVQGQTVGVAIMCHPENFRHPTRWHVRPYGLFAANPFGEADFLPTGTQQGDFTLSAGESLRLRYRVLLHEGDASEACVQDEYARFSSQLFDACSHPQ
ncbi:MAG: PmoA family protein [Lacipirellulaceae bacterium]